MPEPSESSNGAPAPEPPRTRRRAIFNAWFWLLLLIAYPLSTGPALRLCHTLAWSSDPLLEVYTPLRLASRRFTTVNAFFRCYIADTWGWYYFYRDWT